MFVTVTGTETEVAVLAETSRATAVSLWGPFAAVVVFQVTEYGGVVSSVPRIVPSSMNWTPTTASLSAALAVTSIVPPIVPAPGAVIETVGGVVSPETGVALWRMNLPTDGTPFVSRR